MRYLDSERLEAVDARAFRAQRPYPWVNPAGLLTNEGYRRLCETLPDVSRFTRRFDVVRKHGQQSHDRYALEYHPGLELAAPWRDFIRELQGPTYRRFIGRLLGRRLFSLRLHWHYTPNGCSISPHCDSPTKLGSHIFYFNTAEDWEPTWGGQTLILDDGGRFQARSAPRFEDFDRAITAETLGNHSLLFARDGQSWHGMREINCPPHAMRKVFIVVIGDTLRTTARDLVRQLRGKPAESY
ncbi:hypothetical protein KF840_07970 [bacterium]|nr:hypothetical protein [bacterium]